MRKFEINKKVYTFCLSVYKMLDTWVLPLLPILVYVGIACMIALAAGATAALIVASPVTALLIFFLIVAVAVIAVLVVRYCKPKETIDSAANASAKDTLC